MFMDTLISNSASDTEALGLSWGRELSRHCVIGFQGDLGVGKTVLIKGIAKGLGIDERIQSPTFGLVNEYHGGRLFFAHIDLYRLETREQIVGAGLEDYLIAPRGVIVVEWMDRWCGPGEEAEMARSGNLYRHVVIKQISEEGRSIQYEDFGV